MDQIWIIGCGRFGRIALERLSRQKGEKFFMVVDKNTESFPADQQNVKLIEDDGVLFLKNHLDPKYAPDWIIPALPLHLAALWFVTDQGPCPVQRCPSPAGLEKLLPNPISDPYGDIYTSIPDFTCPDDCPEPADHCPATGKKREENLFDRLEKIKIPGFEMLVLKSSQLAAGVGGFKPERLFELHEMLTGKPGKYLLATSCRCHGVVTALSSK